MKQAAAIALTVATAVTAIAAPAFAAWRDVYEVANVEGDDLLKMRAGPATGYVVLLGLPNGTPLIVHDCMQTGSTRWCDVSLEQARNVRGHVSWAYMRKR